MNASNHHEFDLEEDFRKLGSLYKKPPYKVGDIVDMRRWNHYIKHGLMPEFLRDVMGNFADITVKTPEDIQLHKELTADYTQEAKITAIYTTDSQSGWCVNIMDAKGNVLNDIDIEWFNNVEEFLAVMEEE